jgi:uncharacterized protein (TIGR02246 family)
MKTVIFAIFSLLFVSCSSAPICIRNKSEPNSSEFLQKFEQAWNRHDAVSLADLFVDKVEWINILGGHWSGKETITQQHFHLFQGRLKDNQLFIKEITSKNIGKDTVLILAEWQLLKNSLKNFVPYIRKRKGIISLILVPDQTGIWKITFAQGTLKIQTRLSSTEQE